MPRCSFKFAERCLYEYQHNRARMWRIKNTLEALNRGSSVHAQTWGAGIGKGRPGDPVAERALRIIGLEREAARLRGWVEPVSRLLADWDGGVMGDFVQLWYFEKMSRDKVAKALKMSRSAVFRLRQKVVGLAMECLEGTKKAPVRDYRGGMVYNLKRKG